MRYSIFLSMIITAYCIAQIPDTFRTEIAVRQSLLAEIGGRSGIAGTVIDAVSKKPISNVRVEVLGTSNIVLTGPDGQYKLLLLPGFYQVQASANGFAPELKNNVKVKDDAETELFFSLRMDESNPPDFVPVDKQPQPLPGKNPAPKYPELGRKIKMEGIIWIKLLVNEEGNTVKAEIIREEFSAPDPPELLNSNSPAEKKRVSDEAYKAKSQFEEEAKNAALQWKFSPATMAGQKVKVWVSIPFKFKLDNHNDGKKKQ
ncbi:MAG: carboxypeptidase regulatory-like domain-containing protein [Bacteroidota bacterium]